MSLLFYGVYILGVVLGGLVLLVIFSLLAMAQKGDEYLEKLELEMLQAQEYAPPLTKTRKGENQRTSLVSATPDWSHGGTT